ncbi:DUF4255 domain-containing protein [Actinoplanes sp. CA-015351]|uniref:DUF4255 domain-containing protein n=1 Tax=Actinoplanes sp. CA-015351 TaxID=3239897 RepID=UPI003D954454
MSGYRVLDAASEGLRRLLWNSLKDDQALKDLVGTEDGIVFLNPTQTAEQSDRRLSLWLYHVAEDEHLKNTPAVRLTDGTFRMTPLAVDLYYLLTPFALSGQGNHQLLGRSMQTFHDNGIVRITDGQPGGVNEQLRISLYRRSLDEISQVWQALREPYRLSVCYQVKVTRLDSERTDDSVPVIEVSAAWDPDLERAEAS